MISLIQRVQSARVDVEGRTVGAIGPGLLALVAVQPNDGEAQTKRMLERLLGYRVFSDEQGRMNRSLTDTGGGLLLVSQFTLHSSTKKGNRPSYIRASKPDIAIPLYQKMIACLEADLGKQIFTGEFGADMKVDLLNDGPVTILIDTKSRE